MEPSHLAADVLPADMQRCGLVAWSAQVRPEFRFAFDLEGLLGESQHVRTAKAVGHAARGILLDQLREDVRSPSRLHLLDLREYATTGAFGATVVETYLKEVHDGDLLGPQWEVVGG